MRHALCRSLLFLLTLLLPLAAATNARAEDVWVRQDPVYTSNGQTRKPTDTRVTVTDQSLTAVDAEGKSNTLSWSLPPTTLKPGDTLHLTLQSSTNPGAPLAGSWHIVGAGERGVTGIVPDCGSFPGYRSGGDFNEAAVSFPIKTGNGAPVISLSAGRYDDASGNMTVLVTWTYKKGPAPATPATPAPLAPVVQAPPAPHREPTDIRAASSSGDYFTGDSITLTGYVQAATADIFQDGVPAAIAISEGTDLLGQTRTDDSGYFSVTLPAQRGKSSAGGDSTNAQTQWTLLAHPTDASRYADARKIITFNVNYRGSLQATLTGDKASYQIGDSMALAGTVTAEGKAIGGARVQLTLDGYPLAVVDTDASGRFTHSVSLAQALQRSLIQEGFHALVALPSAAGYDGEDAAARLYISVQSSDAANKMQDAQVIAVTGHPILTHVAQLPSTQFVRPTLAAGDRFGEGTRIECADGDETTLLFPFAGKASVQIVVKSRTTLKLARFVDADGVIKLRVRISNPGDITVQANNPGTGRLDYQIVTAAASFTSLHTRYRIHVDASGATSITVDEDAVQITPADPAVAPVSLPAGKAVLIAAPAAATPAPAAPAAARGITIQVPANTAWTRTGIMLRQGSAIRIDATGAVEAAPASDKRPFYHRVPPEGRPEYFGNMPQATLPALSLVGRIGDGPAVPVGAHVTRWIAGPPFGVGELSLGINDDGLGDNSGAWNVTITLLDQPAPGGNAPAPGTPGGGVAGNPGAGPAGPGGPDGPSATGGPGAPGGPGGAGARPPVGGNPGITQTPTGGNPVFTPIPASPGTASPGTASPPATPGGRPPNPPAIAAGSPPSRPTGATTPPIPGSTPPTATPAKPGAPPAAAPAHPLKPGIDVWICDGAVVTLGNGQPITNPAIVADAGSFAFTRNGATNSIAWIAPSNVLQAGDKVALSMEATANPAPYIGANYHVNCAVDPSGESGASNNPAWRKVSPHYAAFSFTFDPAAAGSVPPSIVVTAANEESDGGPSSSIIVTWKYHKQVPGPAPR